jgi:hypothetical protein
LIYKVELIDPGCNIFQKGREMGSCPYSALFGTPGEGPHATRIFGVALVDFLLTVLLAAISSYFLKQPFLLHLLFWIIIGEILHYMFGVETAVLKWLRIRPTCSA